MAMESKYRPDFPLRAYRFALLGMTNDQICAALGVSHQPFIEYRRLHPEFDRAIIDGKHEADAKVAHSLFQRATGYDFTEKKLFMFEGQVIEHSITTHVPPDVQAQSKWLFNRRPDLWRVQKEPEAGADEAPPPVRVVIEVTDGRIRAEPEPAAG